MKLLRQYPPYWMKPWYRAPVLNQARAMLIRADGLEWLEHLHHDSHPFFQSREANLEDQPNADQLLAFLYESEWKRTITRIKAAIGYSARLGWDAAVERAWDEFPLATDDAALG